MRVVSGADPKTNGCCVDDFCYLAEIQWRPAVLFPVIPIAADGSCRSTTTLVRGLGPADVSVDSPWIDGDANTIVVTVAVLWML